jgi:hypothetical protein
MVIIKPGFRPGFRGRVSPPTLARRVHYLAAASHLLRADSTVLRPAPLATYLMVVLKSSRPNTSTTSSKDQQFSVLPGEG